MTFADTQKIAILAAILREFKHVYSRNASTPWFKPS